MDCLVHRWALDPLSHTSQGRLLVSYTIKGVIKDTDGQLMKEIHRARPAS